MRRYIFLAAMLCLPTVAQAATALDALLAADRAYAEAARSKDMVSGLGAIFDADAVMVSGGVADLIRGAEAIRARLAARPENISAKAEWQPVGGGISADRRQGYTYGSFTLRPAGGPPMAQKYLAYWVKRPQGWRVFAYKRLGRREEGPLNAAPAVIGRGGKRKDKPETSLAAAEKAFSDEAQQIGLLAAFTKWGRGESVNIGGSDAIAVGAEAIGNGVAGPEPGSPVTWAADRLLVAPSGDMGVTYGVLHAKSPPPGQPATMPFFTVWARPKPGDPWRYVAE